MTDPESLLRSLVDAVTPLMNRDYCIPFASAWELDPHVAVDLTDGEDHYRNVRAAWQAARTALGDTD